MVCVSVPQPQWWRAEDKAKICQTVVLPLHTARHRREMKAHRVFFSCNRFSLKILSLYLNICIQMLQQIPHVSARGGAGVWARVSYQLLRLQDGLSLLSKDPHDAGTFWVWLRRAGGTGGPSARKTAVGSLYHFLNACCTPWTEHGLQQVRHWKSSLGQIVNYSICVCVYKKPFSPRPPLPLPPLSQKQKKNKFRKRLPRASASWRETLPDKSPNQTVGFLRKP